MLYIDCELFPSSFLVLIQYIGLPAYRQAGETNTLGGTGNSSHLKFSYTNEAIGIRLITYRRRYVSQRRCFTRDFGHVWSGD